jgi:prostaglandin-endoperoxide synthase 2
MTRERPSCPSERAADDRDRADHVLVRVRAGADRDDPQVGSRHLKAPVGAGKRAATGPFDTRGMTTLRSQSQADDSDPRTGGANVLQLVQPKDDGEDRPTRDRMERLVFVVAVTAAEAVAIYLWLRWYVEGHRWWEGVLSLIVGETVETALFRLGLPRRLKKRWGPLEKDAAGGHFRKVQQITGWVGILEIGLWFLWLWIAEAFDPYVAAVVLLVLMHLKHQVEAMAIMDLPYRTGLFSIVGVVSSVAEVAGAVACLALIREHPVWAAAALVLGLLIEHKLQADALRWEVRARDIRLPRDPRWRSPSRSRQPLLYVLTHFPRFWRLVQRVGPLERFVNRRVINRLLAVAEPRPNPLSTMASYTSWASLTDRTFSGRHLPPVPPTAMRPVTALEGPPSVETVAELFRRSGDMVECPKSTVLFAFFAQWFTDGFLRTSRKHLTRDNLRNTLRNESTHEVDLSQLYGLNAGATNQLRAHHDGLLKSQQIKGEEYPPYLCHKGKIRKEFGKLPRPLGFKGIERKLKNRLFAMGTDVTNVGILAFNTLFLREHNRISRQLRAENPGWDDDRLFQTARNVLTVVLLKIVVEEYVNHITPNAFEFRLTPASFPNERWYRPNWMAIEFNLLYRWHSLVPSTFQNGGHVKLEDTLWDSARLTTSGLGQFMAAASSQPAGRIGLFNTPEFLIERAEKPSIAQARVAKLASYNDYRRLCGIPPVTTFREITTDTKGQRELRRVYGSVDDVEFYVGLLPRRHAPTACCRR